MARTSDRVSSIAASILNMDELTAADEPVTVERYNVLLADAKTVAASAMRQDEVKGLRKALRRFIGK